MADLPLICLDASLAVARVLPEATSEMADELWTRWQAEERTIVVPPHFGAELISAVRRARVLGRITAEEETEGVELCASSILTDVGWCWPTLVTWRRAWDWAQRLQRGNIYDTLYLAVTEEVDAEFWTADVALVRALASTSQAVPEWVHPVEP